MSVNIDQVLEETKSSQQNPTVLNACSNEIVLNRFAKLIPRIREFASVNSVMGHVVQALLIRTETADVQFRGKQLKTTTKVNFAFTPAEILGS
jgi:hypothetical protein